MRKITLSRTVLVLFLISWCAWAQPERTDQDQGQRSAQATFVTCTDMIDDGLYQSIKRRAQQAVDSGADYLILEISTYGGLLKTADDIAKLLILDLSPQIHTVAYVATEAISAGALISVSCQDIVMRRNTTIGNCAPITMGGSLEGVEREKAESFTRALFDRAAHANNYPQALLRAMVSDKIEVTRVRRLDTQGFEYFESHQIPTDANVYDVAKQELIVSKDRILTIDAKTALEYGIARAVVANRQGVLDFLAERDKVIFSAPAQVIKTNWSEELVRKLNHPAVTGILISVALLGVYMEFSAPGLGLPGLIAAICFTIVVGSKYLVGMANWVEVAVFFLGIVLLLVEFLVIPGFGVAGIAGIVCILGGIFGMLVRNPPDKLPWPETERDWDLLTQGAQGWLLGVIGFLVLATLLARFLPRLKLFSGLILTGTNATEVPLSSEAATVPARDGRIHIQVGDAGVVVSPLHPTGRVQFENHLVDCVTQGEFMDVGMSVVVLEVHGSRVVVKQAEA